MTRSVKEGYHLTAAFNPVSADMLSDSAGFGCGDGGIADSVKNGGLAVVNVSHDNNNRIALNKVFLLVLAVVNNSVFNRNNNLLFNLCAKLGCNNFRCIKINDLVDGCHDAEREQLFDNLGRSHLEH